MFHNNLTKELFNHECFWQRSSIRKSAVRAAASQPVLVKMTGYTRSYPPFARKLKLIINS